MLSATQLKNVFPNCPTPEKWVPALDAAMTKFEINTKNRMACFLAQTGHESGQFRIMVENLRYTSPKRLMQVWPKRFPTVSSAQAFVDKPEKLANFVYAMRMGNGSDASGDGFRFRGRGLIQLTGRSNYVDAGKAIGQDVIANPDLLTEPKHASMSAAWFWFSRGLNPLADDRTDDDDVEDFKTITQRINGGTIGISERLALLNQILKKL